MCEDPNEDCAAFKNTHIFNGPRAVASHLASKAARISLKWPYTSIFVVGMNL